MRFDVGMVEEQDKKVQIPGIQGLEQSRDGSREKQPGGLAVPQEIVKARALGYTTASICLLETKAAISYCSLPVYCCSNMSLRLFRLVQRAPFQQLRGVCRLGDRSLFSQPLLRIKPANNPNYQSCKQTFWGYPSRLRAPFTRRSYAGHAQDVSTHGHRGSMAIIWTFIGLNTAVFVVWRTALVNRDTKLGKTLQEHFTLSITNINQQRWFTTITSAFSHIDLTHFVFNMVAFHSFATALTMAAGVAPHHLISLSLLSALGGSIAWLRQRVSLAERHPTEIGGDKTRKFNDIPALGASGMVMGLGSALTCLTPFLPMNFMFIPIAIPLWAVTIVYAGADYYLMDKNTGIGHSSHLGGAMVGLAYYAVFLRRLGGSRAILPHLLPLEALSVTFSITNIFRATSSLTNCLLSSASVRICPGEISATVRELPSSLGIGQYPDEPQALLDSYLLPHCHRNITTTSPQHLHPPLAHLRPSHPHSTNPPSITSPFERLVNIVSSLSTLKLRTTSALQRASNTLHTLLDCHVITSSIRTSPLRPLQLPLIASAPARFLSAP
nr:rhomboid-like protein 12, mitochondrial [Quercus suber]